MKTCIAFFLTFFGCVHNNTVSQIIFFRNVFLVHYTHFIFRSRHITIIHRSIHNTDHSLCTKINGQQSPQFLKQHQSCDREQSNRPMKKQNMFSPINKLPLCIQNKNKSTACGTNAHLTGAIILLHILQLKNGHNSKPQLSKLCPLSCNVKVFHDWCLYL